MTVDKHAGKDRSRASRIRKAILKGRASSEDRHWLDRFEAMRARQPGGRKRPRASAPTPAPTYAPPAQPASPEPQASTVTSTGTGTNTSTDAHAHQTRAEEMVRLPLPGVAEQAGPAQQAVSGGPTCNIPDCPACKRRSGGIPCGVTGKTVYPPMGELAAGFAGSMVLSILGIGAKFLRADRQIVPPTAKEQQDMAIAIREVANRRVNVLGAVDDLLMLGGATWNYSTRALVAELEPQREAPEVIVTPAPVKSAEGGGVA